MGKLLLAIAIVLAASAALTIHEEGIDQAYGGALARLSGARSELPAETEPQGQPERSLAEGASVNSGGTNYGRVTDRIKGRVEEALEP